MQRTGESAFLTTLTADASAVVFIDVVESEELIRYTVRIGQRSPLHATANGKAILAFLPAGPREEILKTVPLKRYTDRTLTSLPALRASLDGVRAAGVAVSVDETVRGASGVAAPVYDHEGRVAGACAVGGPTERMKPRLRQLAIDVKTTARTISALLGYDAEPRERR
jgi:IclR family acetate operon transcriptional repressor